MKVIELNQLTKYYGQHKGIENISFDVMQGEIFGFIGPNGAGKSTTIRTLLGLIFPTRGSAKIFGKDIIQEGPQIRSQIGYLPSEVFYYDKMKVIDLLQYAASFYNKDCTARIKSLSELMELNLNRRIEDLSYGNRKKVGIVQGLLHEPDLVFLDEPTSGLDPLMQKKFFQLIHEENARGATVFFSSHILSEDQQLCNRVAIIKSGEIVAFEEIEELRKNNYKKITLQTDHLNHHLLPMEQITNLETKDQMTRFFYRGDSSQLIKGLSRLALTDVLIEDPTLEEIFMHYYE